MAIWRDKCKRAKHAAECNQHLWSEPRKLNTACNSETDLAVALQMFADGNGLLDEIVQILRNDWSQSFRFQNAQDLVASNKTNLCNSMRIAQYHTYNEKESTLAFHSTVSQLTNTALSPKAARHV